MGVCGVWWSASDGTTTTATTTTTTTTTLHSFNGLFSRTTWVAQYQKGKTSLDFLRQETMEFSDTVNYMDYMLDYMQTIFTSLQTDSHINASSFKFYRPDALPDAQTTLSKH